MCRFLLLLLDGFIVEEESLYIARNPFYTHQISNLLIQKKNETLFHQLKVLINVFLHVRYINLPLL